MKLGKKKFIAAVSGGPDSMALLDKYKKNIVGVCHVNYHKRKDSNIDQKIVTDFCKTNKIPLAVYEVNPKIYKLIEKNFQSWARSVRYDFFVKCGKKFKCNDLLVAHNLNDFLETAIMQRNRKSLNFFYGIKPESQYQTLTIYRPLIKDFKTDLEKYCQDKGIAYAIDSSNSQDIYERNRIRKQMSSWSRLKLKNEYKKITERNRKQAKLETVVLALWAKWKKSKYAIRYFVKADPQYQDSLVYVYLKKNNINNINYNKIKLVRDYIVSKKSNNSLRLETDVSLNKKRGRVRIYGKKD